MTRTLYCIKNGSQCTCQTLTIHEQRIGKIIGCMQIIGLVELEHTNGVKYKCKCVECGEEHDYTWGDLNELKSQKCFHINRYNIHRQPMYSWENRRIGDIYRGMFVRCYNKEAAGKNWKNYGGKGIKVCQEWTENPLSFQDWALSHGYTDELTIDRIDSDKDYCPENCQWISLAENVRRAGQKLLTVDDKTMNLSEWSIYINKNPQTVGYYYRKYGEEYTIQYIKDILSCGQNLQNKTAHFLNIDGDVKTITDWAKSINISPDALSAYVVSHGDDDAIRHIKAILTYGYDNAKGNRVYLTIDGVTHAMKEWSKILGYNSDAVGKRYRKYGREAAMQFIQDKLKEQNQQS